MRARFAALSALLTGCMTQGTPPPPAGWANTAPTVVKQVVDRDEVQLLQVAQADLRTWVQVPDVGVRVGDHVLLGQGTPRHDVALPELGKRADTVVDISHVRVVDAETARRVVSASVPQDAVPIGTVYSDLGRLADDEVVVHGVVVKSTNAVGWVWVHLQDGTGDAALGTNDLTIQTQAHVARGQRVSYRGTLRGDVDLGFGYHYDALVEAAERVE